MPVGAKKQLDLQALRASGAQDWVGVSGVDHDRALLRVIVIPDQKGVVAAERLTENGHELDSHRLLAMRDRDRAAHL
jgi:hypothetical protein